MGGRQCLCEEGVGCGVWGGWVSIRARTESRFICEVECAMALCCQEDPVLDDCGDNDDDEDYLM